MIINESTVVPVRHKATAVDLDSTHWSHMACRTASFPMSETNSRTLQTSWKLLASPKLIRTTPSSRPIWCSKSFSVTPGYRHRMSSSIPSIAAAPPGLQTQPVRSDILFPAAACSMNELGSKFPSGWLVQGRRGVRVPKSSKRWENSPRKIAWTLWNQYLTARQWTWASDPGVVTASARSACWLCRGGAEEGFSS